MQTLRGWNHERLLSVAPMVMFKRLGPWAYGSRDVAVI
jgi:hypothetical protein